MGRSRRAVSGCGPPAAHALSPCQPLRAAVSSRQAPAGGGQGWPRPAGAPGQDKAARDWLPAAAPERARAPTPFVRSGREA